MNDEVVFEDPPIPTMGPKSATRWIQPLRDRPGEWARLPLTGHNVSDYNSRYAGEFEFTSRTVDGESVLYGRYIGNDKHPA